MSTKEWVITVLVFILPIIMVIPPLFYEIKEEYEFAFRKPLYKRITRAGKSMIFLAFLLVALSIWKVILDVDSKEKDKKTLVSDFTQEVNKSLETFGLRYEPFTKTVIKTETKIITAPLKDSGDADTFENPLVDVYSQGPNPIIKRQYYSDSNVLMIGISTINPPAIATNIEIQFDVLSYQNRLFKNISDPFKLNGKFDDEQLQPSEKLYGNKVHFLKMYMSKYKSLLTDTLFVFFKVNFKNIKGESQKPLIKVYQILPGQIDVQLQPANKEYYFYVTDFLKRKKAK